MTPRVALDAAFSGERCAVVFPDGRSTSLAVDRWLEDADRADRHLFLDKCVGKTLDVGCGPGRLVGALNDRGDIAIGIDVSAKAVRLARRRGANALECDVYGAVPHPSSWEHVLLADGNIGIGGDPERLLHRIRQLMSPAGTILVEVDPRTPGSRREYVRLRTGEHLSEPFWWSLVGTDAIADIAAKAGLQMLEMREHGTRQVAVLTRVEATTS